MLKGFKSTIIELFVGVERAQVLRFTSESLGILLAHAMTVNACCTHAFGNDHEALFLATSSLTRKLVNHTHHPSHLLKERAALCIYMLSSMDFRMLAFL
jgi:hypothetical protein